MLTCSKCDHHDQIEHVTTRWGNEIHCHFCGNVTMEGMKARWPIAEKAYTVRKPTESEIAIGKKCIQRLTEQYRKSEYYVKPAIIESPLHDNQEDSMAEKPKCSVEGCTKTAHVKGVCDRHYREQFGHSYKPDKKRGQKLEPATTQLAKKAADFYSDEAKQGLQDWSKRESEATEKSKITLDVEIGYKSLVSLIITKYPAYDSEWPPEQQAQWFEGMNKIMALILKEAA